MPKSDGLFWPMPQDLLILSSVTSLAGMVIADTTGAISDAADTSCLGGTCPSTSSVQGVGSNEFLYCYAFVRPEPEPTSRLLAQQLRIACDDWVFFSTMSDPERNVWKAYSMEQMTVGIRHQMREMIIDGAWKQLVAWNVLERYQWILKVDCDSFVLPSMLRKALALRMISIIFLVFQAC